LPSQLVLHRTTEGLDTRYAQLNRPYVENPLENIFGINRSENTVKQSQINHSRTNEWKTYGTTKMEPPKMKKTEIQGMTKLIIQTKAIS